MFARVLGFTGLFTFSLVNCEYCSVIQKNSILPKLKVFIWHLEVGDLYDHAQFSLNEKKSKKNTKKSY